MQITLTIAVILGVVEGLTEYLPISSTGHLILTAKALDLDLENRGVSAYLIVIQGGAVMAVLGIYRKSALRMLNGLAGRDAEGLKLLFALLISFFPAAVVGLLAGDWIKSRLFGPIPVAAALAAGGIAMIAIERLRRPAPGLAQTEAPPLDPATVTYNIALIIGLAQCLALWPGTSRAMVTMVAAMAVGFSPKAAAEYSFLLALPTLGAATGYDLLKEGGSIMDSAGPAALALGFAVSWIVAVLAIKSFLRYLTRHGLAPFGWYRIALAAVVLITLS